MHGFEWIWRRLTNRTYVRAAATDDESGKWCAANEARLTARGTPIDGEMVLIFSGIAVGIAKR